jgi:hypothetical protein
MARRGLPIRGLATAGLLGGLLAGTAAGEAAPDYRLDHPPEVAVEVGRPGSASLTIVPRAGRTVSRSGPILIALRAEPDGAIELPRRRYRRADAADARAEAPRFDLRMIARGPGDHRLEAEVRFWLCGRRVCWPVRDRLSIRVHVGAAAGGGGPP